jgi:hypothetical protein
MTASSPLPPRFKCLFVHVWSSSLLTALWCVCLGSCARWFPSTRLSLRGCVSGIQLPFPFGMFMICQGRLVFETYRKKVYAWLTIVYSNVALGTVQ